MFSAWLVAQGQRQDEVGMLARLADADASFPRQSSRLYVFLSHYERHPEWRRVVKAAHREWRATRRKKIDAKKSEAAEA